jgi:hypothetical protein
VCHDDVHFIYACPDDDLEIVRWLIDTLKMIAVPFAVENV